VFLWKIFLTAIVQLYGIAYCFKRFCQYKDVYYQKNYVHQVTTSYMMSMMTLTCIDWYKSGESQLPKQDSISDEIFGSLSVSLLITFLEYYLSYLFLYIWLFMCIMFTHACICNYIKIWAAVATHGHSTSMYLYPHLNSNITIYANKTLCDL
jgi:hypothetical protein